MMFECGVQLYLTLPQHVVLFYKNVSMATPVIFQASSLYHCLFFTCQKTTMDNVICWMTQRLLMMTVVCFPVAGLGTTPTYIPTHWPPWLLVEDTLQSRPSIPVSLRMWFMQLIAVPATKCTSERLADTWVTNFENIYALLNYRHWPPLYIP